MAETEVDGGMGEGVSGSEFKISFSIKSIDPRLVRARRLFSRTCTGEYAFYKRGSTISKKHESIDNRGEII